MALFLVACIVILLSVLWFLIKRDPNPIDQLPGPPTLPFFGNVFLLAKPKRELFDTLNQLVKKYPKIYRIWQTKYIPSIYPLDPIYLEAILTSTVHISKSHEYDIVADWLGYGLLTSTGSKWHSRRKLLTPAFHFSILEQFVPVFSDKTRILIEKLRQHVDKPDGVDVLPLVTHCALDIICKTAMGCDVNAQADESNSYVKALYELQDILFYRAYRPWLYPDWIFNLCSPGRKYKECREIVHSFTKKVIRERRETLKLSKIQNPGNENDIYVDGKKIKTAFLDLLLRASEHDPSLTDDEIRSEVDTFMFEGHDTTAMAMNWALYHLSVHLDIQEKCVEELTDIFSGSDRDPTLTDLGNMKYLERVIKETLRISPSVVAIGRRTDKHLKLKGYEEFAPNTKVYFDIYNIHRNPEYFPDPEKFDPDRFLPENCVGRHPYAYIPFSAGPRNCIGQKFAMLEMKNLLSTVLRHFRFESCDPEKYGKEDPDLMLRPMHGNYIRLHNRSVT